MRNILYTIVLVCFATVCVAQSPFASSKQSILFSNAQSGASERWISLFAPSALATNYRLIFPTSAPVAGDFLNIASVSGNDYTLQWTSLNTMAWSTTGNSALNYTTRFIGTTDTSSFVIRTNNKDRLRFDNNGAMFFGKSDNSAFTYTNPPTYGSYFDDAFFFYPTYTAGDQSELRLYIMDNADDRFAIMGINDATISGISWSTNLNDYVPSFYVEGDGDTYVRKNLGIGDSSFTSTVSITGSYATNFSVQAGSGTVTLDNSTSLWYFTGTASITLPSAGSCSGRTYTIVNRSGSSRTISTYYTLSGSTSTSISANTSIDLISDGSTWYRVR